MSVKREVVVSNSDFITGSKHTFKLDGVVYRGYNNINAPDIRKLMFNVEKLYDIGFVRTSIAPIASKQFSMVLQHETIDFISYREEWTSKMLLDAAILMIDLQTELVKNEMCLYDGHSLNILFDYTRPVFVDFDSITSLSGSLAWFNGFYPQFVNDIAERSNEDPEYWNELCNKTVNVEGANRTMSNWQDAFLTLLSETRSWLSGMSVNAKVTPWSGYVQPTEELTNNKQKVTAQLLDRLYSDGMTLLDVGANEGWYSNFAESKGYRVVAVEIDEQCTTKLYLQAKEVNRKILPLTFNLLKPWCADPPRKNAVDRLKCDIVLGLAVVHHMVFSQKSNFTGIASKFNDFSKKYCIIEFPPEDDVFVHNWVTPETSWYNLDNFIAEMSKYFPKHEIFDSHPLPRKIILFEK
uniref:Putative methyltransferase n=1 Tax=viral metagenome TaxID=1070528 RepID=A0A6M3K658_9ZZZZ